MLIRLSIYDLEVKYVGAKCVLLADTLSRLVAPGKDKAIPGLNIKIAQVMKIRSSRLASLQDETKCDPILTQLAKLVNNGWPGSMQDLPDELHHYWPFRDELVILDGLVMKGNRVIVPSSLRDDTLKILHEGHQGTSGILKRARLAQDARRHLRHGTEVRRLPETRHQEAQSPHSSDISN